MLLDDGGSSSRNTNNVVAKPSTPLPTQTRYQNTQSKVDTISKQMEELKQVSKEVETDKSVSDQKVSKEVENVKSDGREIFFFFSPWFLYIAELNFAAQNGVEYAKNQSFNSMCDILMKDDGENLVKVTTGTIVGLGVACWPLALATLGLSYAAVGYEAIKAALNDEHIANAMINGFSDTSATMGVAYVASKLVLLILKEVGFVSGIAGLGIESALETLVEELTYI